MRNIRLAAAGTMGLAVAVFFYHLGTYGLWEPDEARYAEIAREMLATRSFLLPHLNYVPYVEKPPLLYWLTALSFRIFGLSELAARLPCAVSALTGVAATWFFTLRTTRAKKANLAAAVLVTTPLYAVMAQVLTTDMLLTAAVTSAFFALFLQWHEGGQWWIVSSAAMALGTLAKGPVAIVLPVLSLSAFILWERPGATGGLVSALERSRLIPGALLAVVLAAPWFVWMSMRVPGFFSFYFVGEHLRRFLDTSYSHGGPFYYYAPVVLGGFLPWSAILPLLNWRGVLRNPACRFSLCAVLVTVGFYSLASSKLIPYVLPAFPPLAVLTGSALSVSLKREPAAGKAPAAGTVPRLLASGPIVGLLGAIAIGVAHFAPQFRGPYVQAVRPALYGVGAIGVTGGLVVTALLWYGRRSAAVAALVVTLAVALAAGSWGRIEAEPLRSYAALCKTVARKAPDAQLICYPRYVESLPFYCQRRVILVGAPTELSFGSTHSADARNYFFRGEAALLKLWERPGPKVLVVDSWALRRLDGKLGSYDVIASEWTKRAIVKSRIGKPD